MGKGTDIALSIAAGVVNTATAPVRAAVEVLADGDVSSDTATHLISGLVGDATGAALDDGVPCKDD